MIKFLRSCCRGLLILKIYGILLVPELGLYEDRPWERVFRSVSQSFTHLEHLFLEDLHCSFYGGESCDLSLVRFSGACHGQSESDILSRNSDVIEIVGTDNIRQAFPELIEEHTYEDRGYQW